MREIRTSGSRSGEWKRSKVGYSGTGNRKGRSHARPHLNHRATPRLYFQKRVAQGSVTLTPDPAIACVAARPLCHLCAVQRRRSSVGAIPTRQEVAPAGSNRSGSGGNDTAEAFDGKGRLGRLREQAGRNVSERRAGLETGNVGADLASGWGRPPSRVSLRGATTPLPWSHRGNGDGMFAQGDRAQHGKPQRWETSPNRKPARDRSGRVGWRTGS